MVRLMVRYWKYVLVAVALVAVLFLLSIANVVVAPDIKSFILAANVVAAIVSGIIGSIFGVLWVRSTPLGD